MTSIKPKLKENDETKNVRVNNYLSRETIRFLKYARSLKSVGYRAVYSVGGRVFAKRSELSKPKLLKNEDDVGKLLNY